MKQPTMPDILQAILCFFLASSLSVLLVLLLPASAVGGTEQVVHQFLPLAQGARPYAGLVADGAGNLYGTSFVGGVYQCGVVFELSRGTNGTWRQSVLYSFLGSYESPADSCEPFAGLTIDAAGNLYGTTLAGGTAGGGTVYSLTPNGNGKWGEHVLYNFPINSSSDGSQPYGGVTIDASGNIFGTTSQGGPNGGGTVFELSPSGSSWTETVLYGFPGGTQPESPFNGVVEDAQGNLYGTTAPSSAQRGGSIWELSPSATGWNFQTLYVFAGNGTGDGQYPTGLVLDSSGNLYGTTTEGGKSGFGMVFELEKSSGTWRKRILYDFLLNNGGVQPASPPIFDGKGNLYGTVEFVGTNRTGPDGGGAVYQLTHNSQGGWTEATLYTFQGGSDGSNPWGGLVQDANGNLYGTTTSGGTAQIGTVFEMTQSGGAWTETSLYTFPVTDGGISHSGLVADTAGNLYGTTTAGGLTVYPCDLSGWGGCGTVFKLSPTSAGGWQESTIYYFTGQADGMNPLGNLSFDAAGNLYGTTSEGGFGAGSVFKLSPVANNTWTETTLFSFGGLQHEGYGPLGPLAFDGAGNVYGTTLGGGDAPPTGAGTVFKLKPNTSGTWTEQVLYSFQGESDGGFPQSGVVIDTAGNLYGTAPGGASQVAFKLSPGQKGGWTETVIHTFSGTGDGVRPASSLIFDRAGNLYGTTESGGTYGYGTVYELSPAADGTWTETILHSFAGPPYDGYEPQASLTVDAMGNLYGTTVYGGDATSSSCALGNEFDCGAVFKLSPGSNGVWNESLVYSLTGGRWDGSNPSGSVFVDAGGHIFGTTSGSGLSNAGVVFEIAQ